MSAKEPQVHHRRAAEHAQRRAVWEFVSTVADWRCGLCMKSIDFSDLHAFGRTRLCPKCAGVVASESGWLPASIEGKQ